MKQEGSQIRPLVLCSLLLLITMTGPSACINSPSALCMCLLRLHNVGTLKRQEGQSKRRSRDSCPDLKDASHSLIKLTLLPVLCPLRSLLPPVLETKEKHTHSQRAQLVCSNWQPCLIVSLLLSFSKSQAISCGSRVGRLADIPFHSYIQVWF